MFMAGCGMFILIELKKLEEVRRSYEELFRICSGRCHPEIRHEPVAYRYRVSQQACIIVSERGLGPPGTTPYMESSLHHHQQSVPSAERPAGCRPYSVRLPAPSVVLRNDWFYGNA